MHLQTRHWTVQQTLVLQLHSGSAV